MKQSLQKARRANKARARAAGRARAQRVRVIYRLRADGLTYDQIGVRLGLKPSTVRDYASDPKRRRAKQRQRNLARRKARARAAGRTWKPIRAREHGRVTSDAQRRAIVGAYAYHERTGEWPPR